MRPNSRASLLLLCAPVVLLLAGAIGIGVYLINEPTQEAQAVALNETLTESSQLEQDPLDAKVESILFEPQRDTAESQAQGVWEGAIVMRDGTAVPFRIQGVDSTGFTAVGVRCLMGEECQIGVDVDQALVAKEQVQRVVDDLLAVARQMTAGNTQAGV